MTTSARSRKTKPGKAKRASGERDRLAGATRAPGKNGKAPKPVKAANEPKAMRLRMFSPDVLLLVFAGRRRATRAMVYVTPLLADRHDQPLCLR